MTPELRTACEVVFQEHKVSAQPIKWSSETFRGRISLGLSDLAKDTLVKKKIIVVPNKSKKVITQLNPVVASAASFEEAEDIITNKKQVPVIPAPTITIAEKPAPALNGNGATKLTNGVKRPVMVELPKPRVNRPVIAIGKHMNAPAIHSKWYLKPLFFYVIWPICGAAAGAMICILLDWAYDQLFLH